MAAGGGEHCTLTSTHIHPASPPPATLQTDSNRAQERHSRIACVVVLLLHLDVRKTNIKGVQYRTGNLAKSTSIGCGLVCTFLDIPTWCFFCCFLTKKERYGIGYCSKHDFKFPQCFSLSQQNSPWSLV